MTIDKFIEIFKTANLTQMDYFEEDILNWDEELQNIWKAYIVSRLATGVNPDNYRHYQTTEEYFRLSNGGILGVEVLTTVFSEYTHPQDLGHRYRFFEGETEELVTYKEKKWN